MTTLADLKAAHLAAADTRWEHAVEDMTRLLNYRNDAPGAQGHYYSSPEHIAAVREVTRRLLTCDGMVRFYLLGGTLYGRPEAKYTYYPDVCNEDPCSLMEFIRFFVSHELLDDGEPGLAFYKRQDRVGECVPCGPDDPDAQPYFHRCVDVLRDDYPNAQWLSVELALEVLTKTEEEHEAFEARMNLLYEEERYAPSKQELQLRALAEELTHKGG